MEMMDEINRQMMETPYWVQRWMDWMAFIFVSAVLFVRRHPEARWALVTFALTMVTAFGVFAIKPDVHLFGLGHVIWWTPLLIYYSKQWKSDPKYRTWSPYKVWFVLNCTTMVVSLLFDVRDLFKIFFLS